MQRFTTFVFIIGNYQLSVNCWASYPIIDKANPLLRCCHESGSRPKSADGYRGSDFSYILRLVPALKSVPLITFISADTILFTEIKHS